MIAMSTFHEVLSPEVMTALPGYLMAQRWFGAKARQIAAVSVDSMFALPTAAGALALVRVDFIEGQSETYQLALATAEGRDATELRAASPHACIAELADGVLLYDGCASSHFRSALLAALGSHDAVSGLTGNLVSTFHLQESLPASRVSSAEQSNTSIFFGDDLVMKLYRRIQPGENPDVELPRFLAERTSFRSTPEYLGDLRDAGATLTLAFLQRFAANDGDAWKWFGTQLEAHLAAPAASNTEAARSTLEAAREIGGRTAELHFALASSTTDEAFAPEPYTSTALAAESSRIHAQIISALDLLKQRVSALDAGPRTLASQLLSRRQQLLNYAHTLATASPSRFGQRIRIHGDYHLGQLLHTSGDTAEALPGSFLIVDFEGEPSRSIEARRRKDSPLRDIAGMLRSFSYAAAAAIKTKPDHTAEISARAARWEQAVSAQFLAAYQAAMADTRGLLPHPPQRAILLNAYLMEKALYELEYELNNRPTWVGIPLQGILSLLDQTVLPESANS